MKDGLRLSVSKTKVFFNCKAQYKYQYVDKIPVKIFDFHTLGKFCHKVLEDFHVAYINGCQEPYNIVMSKAFKQAVEKYKKDMNPEMKRECWDIINQYLKKISNDKKNNITDNVLACEKNFEFPLGGQHNVILNGMIDRIQLDADNVMHVCDYKSTKNKKYLKDDFLQLLTYAHVILLEDPVLTTFRASYILLRHNFEYITMEFKAPEILKIKQQYLDYADQIMQEKEFEPNPTKLCEYCSYNDICAAGKKMISPSKIYGAIDW
jgi:ATP-dependent helicase/DNAse subunit B